MAKCWGGGGVWGDCGAGGGGGREEGEACCAGFNERTNVFQRTSPYNDPLQPERFAFIYIELEDFMITDHFANAMKPITQNSHGHGPHPTLLHENYLKY